MADTYNIGIAGLGTVGVGVIDILNRHGDLLAKRAGRPVAVRAVSARDRHRDRGVDISGYDWCDDPVALARRDDLDLIVELIGGSDGPALALAQACLEGGRAFVTANKALMAYHGADLAVLADRMDAPLAYEAAVAGGIPVIKALKEGLAGNEISHISGILNGTCNYILTKMEEDRRDFGDVLAEAQQLGYAEADPTFDIDGHDSAHKAVILAMLAFHAVPAVDTAPVVGIRALDTVDIDYARELGYKIKLLGTARRTEDGIEVCVHPAMVPLDHALAGVRDATNAVMIQGDAVGETVYIGPGAGRGPTASAVVGDIIDIVRGHTSPALGRAAHDLPAMVPLDDAQRFANFYIRLRVNDAVGVVAEVAQLLSDADVSIDGLLQRGRAAKGGVYLVITTHATTEARAADVVAALDKLDNILEPPALLRIEA